MEFPIGKKAGGAKAQEGVQRKAHRWCLELNVKQNLAMALAMVFHCILHPVLPKMA